MALAGCMAIDVADIVIKGRHPLTALEATHRRAAPRRSAAPLRQLHAALRAHRQRARARASSGRFSSRATSTARCGIRCGRTSVCETTLRGRSWPRKVYLDWLRGVAVVDHGRRARHRRVDARWRIAAARSTCIRSSSPAWRRRCSCSSPA